jgi:uncharacterized protein YjeT (DUF2065 family)
MSPVGVASIALGIVIFFSRAALMLVPARFLGWFGGVIEKRTGVRIFGLFLLVLGGALMWAGSTQQSGLASILSIFGWWTVGASVIALILFPNIYRELAQALLPMEGEENLPGWRFIGGLGMLVGLALIYYGALAL